LATEGRGSERPPAHTQQKLTQSYQKPKSRPKFPPKPKNRKKNRSKTEKPAENNAKNRKFVVFNPSTLDTAAKYWPWGPFSTPVILLAARIQSHVHYPKGNKAIASSIAFASYEAKLL